MLMPREAGYPGLAFFDPLSLECLMDDANAIIVRINRNCFDGNTAYDATRTFADGSSCQTVTRVPADWANRELTEHKDKAPIEKATESDLAAFEAAVANDSAGSAAKKKKK